MLETALYGGLAHLQAAEFLYETRLFLQHEDTFKHAFTYEVAYGSLLHERRQLLHTRIVEAREALAGDRLTERVERLAHDALRGEVWDKTLKYCRQAGEKAMTRSAYYEAVGYFEQALRRLQHLPERQDMDEQAIDLRLSLSLRQELVEIFSEFWRLEIERPQAARHDFTLAIHDHGGRRATHPKLPGNFHALVDQRIKGIPVLLHVWLNGLLAGAIDRDREDDDIFILERFRNPLHGGILTLADRSPGGPEPYHDHFVFQSRGIEPAALQAWQRERGNRRGRLDGRQPHRRLGCLTCGRS